MYKFKYNMYIYTGRVILCCTSFTDPYRYQSNTAKSCLDTILNIQPKDSSSGGGETRESIVKRQAGEMLEKLPNDYLPHEVSVLVIALL